MANDLPEPKSRKESYLAKAAGMDVTIPEKPEGRLEQYLNAIAENGGGGGGGGSYSAGDGITIANNKISVDLVQTTGTDTKKVMSQKAVTDALANAGGIKELTTADYNYPASNPTGVSVALLPAGLYRAANNDVYIYNGTDINKNRQDLYFLVSKTDSNGWVYVWVFNPEGRLSASSYKITCFQANPSTGAFSTLTDSGRIFQADYITQSTGQSQSLVMSQKAVTDALASAGGGVKTLTSADYNYHYSGSEDDGIALWLLDEGQYLIGDNVNAVKYYYSRSQYRSDSNPTGIVVIKKPVSTRRGFIIEAAGGSTNNYIIKSIDTSGNNGERVLLPTVIANTLTTSSASIALSAEQGKTLKDLIDGLVIANAGAPTTSTVGTVGQLLEDTTNGDLYICTDATNPYVWEQVGAGGSGPTVVQTTGTSTTDVMSQNAVTSMVFADPGTNAKIQIGSGANVTTQNDNMAIGHSASANGLNSMAIGASASSRGNGVAIGVSAKAGNTSSQTSAVALGYSAQALGAGAIALGRNSSANTQGEMNIGSSETSYGYNSTNYRLLSGVHDGQGLHDAATVAQGNTLSTSAPDTSTVGVLGQLWTDTTNMHTYQCTAISGSTYTWTQRW